MRVALAFGVPVVLVLGLSQIVLPRVAEQRVRDRLKPYGTLESVSVSAFPAIELLWGKADSASASARELSLSEAQAVRLVQAARGVRDADLKVATLKLEVPGLPYAVALHDATVLKRGDRVSTQATLSQSDLDAASPSGVRIRPLAGGPGTVRMSASGSLFGLHATVEAVAMPSEGKLVAQPLSIPFGSFVRLTLFSDPHVYIDSVSATPEREGAQSSWRVALGGRLR